MKNYIYPAALAVMLLSAASCKKNIDVPVIPDEDKDRIEFSLSDRNGNENVKAGFSATKTKIVARFVSTDNTNTRYTLTTMKAGADANSSVGNWWTTSAVSYYADNHSDDRYWDDAFGRNANISVYAIAVPNIDDRGISYPTLYDLFKNTGTSVGTTPWKTGTDDQQISWSVEKLEQTSYTINQEDLAYSNNIKTGGKGGVYRYDFVNSRYPDYATHDTELDKWTGPNTTDGPLTFQMAAGAPAGSPGKFDKGHMNFMHALSRITVELYAGKGFNMDLDPQPFTFKSEKNIDLISVPYSGTFDILTGNWLSSPTLENILKLSSTLKATTVTEENKSTTPVYTVSGQILPGYVFDGNATSTNVMHFNIDNNDYYVTSAQVYQALKNNAGSGAGKNGLDTDATSYTMEQGKNYLLKITVNKTEIANMTSTIVDWVEIAGSHTATNGYISLNLLDAGSTNTHACETFDFYRALNTSTTISTPAAPGFTGTPNNTTGYNVDPHLSTEVGADFNHVGLKWNSIWFFKDNYSFYHFRTLMPGTALTTDAVNGDYFKMYSGPMNDTWTSSDETPVSTAARDGRYNDYHWGATYDSTTGSTAGYLNYNDGFSHLSGPIGPYKNTNPSTDPTLNIIEQHMMANIRIIVETPAYGDSDYAARVLLYDSSKGDARKASVITLTNLYPEATVRMGNGKIEPDGDLGDAEITHPAWGSAEAYFETSKVNVKSKPYTYRVIPQDLVRSSGKVGIIIQTPDDNVYYVVEDLSNITVNGAPTGHPMKGDHSNGAKITTWYPGYTYTYTFKLKKTGIENITCTIIDWVNVEAASQEITLED